MKFTLEVFSTSNYIIHENCYKIVTKFCFLGVKFLQVIENFCE